MLKFQAGRVSVHININNFAKNCQIVLKLLGYMQGINVYSHNLNSEYPIDVKIKYGT